MNTLAKVLTCDGVVCLGACTCVCLVYHPLVCPFFAIVVVILIFLLVTTITLIGDGFASRGQLGGTNLNLVAIVDIFFGGNTIVFTTKTIKQSRVVWSMKTAVFFLSAVTRINVFLYLWKMLITTHYSALAFIYFIFCKFALFVYTLCYRLLLIISIYIHVFWNSLDCDRLHSREYTIERRWFISSEQRRCWFQSQQKISLRIWSCLQMYRLIVRFFVRIKIELSILVNKFLQ